MNRKEFTQLLQHCGVDTNETNVIDSMWNHLKEANYIHSLKDPEWPPVEDLASIEDIIKSDDPENYFDRIKQLLQEAYKIEVSKHN